MSCTLIINPRSRNGRCKKHLEGIIKSCRDEFTDVNILYASTYDAIKKHSLLANSNNDNLIVAVGGDGTINAVLNGFFNDKGMRISESKFGVIYTGTSPDFCRSYNISLNHQEAIKCLKNGHVKKIRPGRICIRTKNGAKHDQVRYFACCANVGIGAGIARDANHIRKYIGDIGGTFISLLKNLLMFRVRRIFLEIDHQLSCVEKSVNISVGRTPYIASGIKVNDDEIINQDRFYILIAAGLRLYNLPGLFRQIYSGNIGRSKYLQLRQGKTIMLNSDGPDVEVEFDGDPAGYLPCSIETAYDTVDLLSNVE